MANKRVCIFYSGQVQGVGFRYTVEDIAMGLGISGWVKNLRDGRVEIIAEGEEKNLKEFLDKIVRGALGHYIREVDVSWEKPTGEFDSFDIRFDF